MIPVLSAAIALIVILSDRRKMHRIMDGLSELIDEAMDGNFIEDTFDESKRSSLESQLAQYLAASSLSSRNIAAEKEKIKTLIADISHQTKTPIANLLLYSELLQELKPDGEAANYTDALHSQAEKLQFLIDALVKLSRLETGILTLRPKQGDILPTISEAAEQFRAKADAKGLFLTVEQTNACAVFDAKWTNEALCNLLDNAIKYTEQGGITVRVKPYAMFVCIELTDTGIGIAEAEQAKIFSRFYRSHRTDHSEGVGIGLYLARQIISGEGGYMKVSSSPGKGSTFSVYLPRRV